MVPTHTYEKFVTSVISHSLQLRVMFSTHLFAHREGIMRAQPGGSNHNLRVYGRSVGTELFILA